MCPIYPVHTTVYTLYYPLLIILYLIALIALIPSPLYPFISPYTPSFPLIPPYTPLYPLNIPLYPLISPYSPYTHLYPLNCPYRPSLPLHQYPSTRIPRYGAMGGGTKCQRKDTATIATMRVVLDICSTFLPTTGAFSALCTTSELFLLLTHLQLPNFYYLLLPPSYYRSPKGLLFA